jgi:hypothetical protein
MSTISTRIYVCFEDPTDVGFLEAFGSLEFLPGERALYFLLGPVDSKSAELGLGFLAGLNKYSESRRIEDRRSSGL